jgi:fatty-acyl-CoA synthase
MMMDRPLLISGLVAHAARYHGETEIVSRTVEGGLHRYGYAELERRAKRLAKALQRLGIGVGDRVAMGADPLYGSATSPMRSIQFFV